MNQRCLTKLIPCRVFVSRLPTSKKLCQLSKMPQAFCGFWPARQPGRKCHPIGRFRPAPAAATILTDRRNITSFCLITADLAEFQDMLRCIRCAACMNHFSVYCAVGGHASGLVYPGPIRLYAQYASRYPYCRFKSQRHRRNLRRSMGTVARMGRKRQYAANIPLGDRPVANRRYRTDDTARRARTAPFAYRSGG